MASECTPLEVRHAEALRVIKLFLDLDPTFRAARLGLLREIATDPGAKKTKMGAAVLAARELIALEEQLRSEAGWND